MRSRERKTWAGVRVELRVAAWLLRGAESCQEELSSGVNKEHFTLQFFLVSLHARGLMLVPF